MTEIKQIAVKGTNYTLSDESARQEIEKLKKKLESLTELVYNLISNNVGVQYIKNVRTVSLKEPIVLVSDEVDELSFNNDPRFAVNIYFVKLKSQIADRVEAQIFADTIGYLDIVKAADKTPIKIYRGQWYTVSMDLANKRVLVDT